MKSITPINIWNDGQLKEVTKIEVASVYDDLNTYASFVYRLKKEVPAVIVDEIEVIPAMFADVVTGNVMMNGQDYIDWDNSNDAAYDWVAEKLNLTIVADPQP